MTVYFNEGRTAYCNRECGNYSEAVEVDDESVAIALLRVAEAE